MTWRTIIILLAIWAAYRLIRRVFTAGLTSGQRPGGTAAGSPRRSARGREQSAAKGGRQGPDKPLENLTQQDISDADYEEIP